MNKKSVLAILACGLFFTGISAQAARRPAPVKVTLGAYHGWPNAYRLSNGVVEAVVVPSIGRIMAFEFTGQPQTNPLFNNPAWAGKPAPPAPNPADPKTYPTEWHNYGGDKLWPSEQGQWAKHQPLEWPPDPAFDDGPYCVTKIPNGLRLISPVSPYYATQVIRDITLTPGAARLTLHDTFIKSRDAAGDKTGFPIGIWSVSQVRDGAVYLPLNKQGLFPDVGFTSLGDKPEVLPNWQAQGDLLVVTRPNNVSTKVGLDDSAGWMALLYDKNLLFSEHFMRIPKGKYPDKDTNSQVYTSGDPAYIEMEVLGPMVNLQAGQTLSRPMFWRLERLPRTPGNNTEARTLVQAAMAGK